jgi:hypothetical protein
MPFGVRLGIAVADFWEQYQWAEPPIHGRAGIKMPARCVERSDKTGPSQNRWAFAGAACIHCCGNEADYVVG